MLVRGLSINSATVVHLHAEEQIGKKRQDEVVVDGTPEQVDRAFEALLRPGKRN